MPVTHVVKQGEYLSKIAHKYGFSSYTSIWDRPENAELKNKRKNPNILYPGDKLFIPDKEEKTDSAPTGKKHSYEAKTGELKLLLVMRDADDYPIAGQKYDLEVSPQTFSNVTGGDGLINETISVPHAEDGTLRILDLEIPLKIGHLDPVEEISGQQARLNNLGYDAGPLDGSDEYKRRSAVEEFQCNNKPPLKVSGVCDTKTQARLVAVHGC